MARLSNIPSGSGSANPSAPVLDVGSTPQGAVLQNAGAVDIYISEDRTRLDATSPALLPQAGILLSAVAQNIVVIPRIINTVWYGRSQAPGAQLEVITYDLC
jgi:hypothetical protein